jgi:hypothetical protein
LGVAEPFIGHKSQQPALHLAVGDRLMRCFFRFALRVWHLHSYKFVAQTD